MQSVSCTSSIRTTTSVCNTWLQLSFSSRSTTSRYQIKMSGAHLMLHAIIKSFCTGLLFLKWWFACSSLENENKRAKFKVVKTFWWCLRSWPTLPGNFTLWSVIPVSNKLAMNHSRRSGSSQCFAFSHLLCLLLSSHFWPLSFWLYSHLASLMLCT